MPAGQFQHLPHLDLNRILPKDYQDFALLPPMPTNIKRLIDQVPKRMYPQSLSQTRTNMPGKTEL